MVIKKLLAIISFSSKLSTIKAAEKQLNKSTLKYQILIAIAAKIFLQIKTCFIGIGDLCLKLN
ncbi:MAG: hypothetical protein K2X39_00335 [Silvanigrellaceae bacterium]|nr:hypothetical protein [Silvanigrellaceae bacterium]